ncbi:MAG: ornithine carbamoyltransferase, partial [Oscillospiraceae bacterium]|nr:ornithine carbamoyltransferase [Oscillospiraceae bacterium]
MFEGRSFLKLLDFTPDEITQLLELAADLKKKKRTGTPHAYHQGKNIA